MAERRIVAPEDAGSTPVFLPECTYMNENGGGNNVSDAYNRYGGNGQKYTET